MRTVLYFAYGSNLDPAQMRRRCPGACIEGPATLRGYRLAFAGHSRTWGGAVATAVPERGVVLEGVLYRVPTKDLATLDRCEGHPLFYERHRVKVRDAEGRRRVAHAYVLAADADEGPPPARYRRMLQRAYRRHGFNHEALAAAAGGMR